MARLSGELLHDLNNALATLSALTEMAAAEAREGRSTLASIDRIRTACGQLRRVVRDVSDSMLGRATSAEVEFDPATAARAAFDEWVLTAPPLEISFHCDLPPGARVGGRESFFHRALSNLLRNASRHARREIRVRIACAEVDSGPGMAVTVEDDGPGIDGALADRLFEPFVHGDHGGLGLGLSMVRWGTEQLGGTVALGERSLLGGAQFVLSVPLRYPSTMPTATAATRGPLPLSGYTIAVVDDDAALRRLYGRLLDRDGAVAIEFDPHECRTAEDMAARIASAPVDAVVLDAEMGAFSGVAVWEALRRTAPEAAARTLFVSGHVPDSSAGLAELRDRWMVKDAEWASLRAAILGLLEPEN